MKIDKILEPSISQQLFPRVIDSASPAVEEMPLR
jgi:hypothetical protein